MTIDEKQGEITERFSGMSDIIEKYEHLVRLGKAHPRPGAEFEKDEHALEGCDSRVWIKSEIRDGRVHYLVDSDSTIIRGILALVMSVLDGHTPDEIAGARLHFIETIGLDKALSPSRANGLTAIMRRMRDI